MNIDKYLYRINYEGAISPDFAVLKKLQENNMFNVPFENLDIHYGRVIELDNDQFYKKIVEEKRGGFCYELNGIFHELLKEIGFKSKMVSARVFKEKSGEFGEEFDHLVLIVEINKKEFLVDVGFGEFAMNPLELGLSEIQEDPQSQYLIEKVNEDFIVFKINGSIKSILYKFENKARELHEFSEMCNYHQTSPESHFTQKRLISRPIDKGRITITDNTLKITEEDVIKKQSDFPKEEYAQYLDKYFKMDEARLLVFLEEKEV